MASRELRNNNYLNLKNGGYPWMDANGKDRELIHRVMRSLPILPTECAPEFYCCALIFFTYNLRTVAENLACWRQPMTPSFPAGCTSQLNPLPLASTNTTHSVKLRPLSRLSATAAESFRRCAGRTAAIVSFSVMSSLSWDE